MYGKKYFIHKFKRVIFPLYIIIFARFCPLKNCSTFCFGECRIVFDEVLYNSCIRWDHTQSHHAIRATELSVVSNCQSATTHNGNKAWSVKWCRGQYCKTNKQTSKYANIVKTNKKQNLTHPHLKTSHKHNSVTILQTLTLWDMQSDHASKHRNNTSTELLALLRVRGLHGLNSHWHNMYIHVTKLST
jgi:hypothetical protein